LQQAEAEAARLREAASREGYEAGRAAAMADLESERRRLGELIAQLDVAYRQFCADQVPALARIAVQATGQLLRGQLQLEPEHVLAVVDQALERVVASSHVLLHLHPDDEEMVRLHLTTYDARQAGGVEIVVDESVERGGCWLETEHGEIDATVSGRLDRLARALDEAA
jgi:flagellar assembly protein FliH